MRWTHIFKASHPQEFRTYCASHHLRMVVCLWADVSSLNSGRGNTAPFFCPACGATAFFLSARGPIALPMTDAHPTPPPPPPHLIEALLDSAHPRAGMAGYMRDWPTDGAPPDPAPDDPGIETILRLNHDAPDLDRAALRARLAAAPPCDGIELIFPLSLYGHRRVTLVRDLLGVVRRDSGGRSLTIMLETGMLNDAMAIHDAALLAIAAGAERIGTASGRLAAGSDPRAAELLLRIAADAQRPCGVKIGALPDLASAAAYRALALRLLGPNWVGPDRLRLELVAPATVSS